MRELIKIMKALSDPNRIKVLKALEIRELCVCEIQPLLKVSQSTVSKHMKMLEDVGLVLKRKEGQWVVYRLGPNESSPYAAEMLNVIRAHLNDEPEVTTVLSEVPNVGREKCAVPP